MRAHSQALDIGVITYMSNIIKEFKQKDSFGTNRTYIEYQCDNCGTNHSKPKKNLKTKNFCSPKCYNKSLCSQITVTCALCDKEHTKKKSQLHNSKSGLYFCSRVCKDKGQSIEGGIKEIQPPHYNTGEFTYREKAFSSYPHKCNRCNYNELIDILEVHHKDCDRTNNNLENLEILCPNCHLKDHFINKTGKFTQNKS